MRVDDELITLEPLSAVLVEPEHLRQLFNDTDDDALWLVVGAPRGGRHSTLEMTEEQLAAMYPDGPKALPPELGGGQFPRYLVRGITGFKALRTMRHTE